MTGREAREECRVSSFAHAARCEFRRDAMERDGLTRMDARLYSSDCVI